ncbi:MAG: hypothetical protein ABFD94_10455 [Armatimonadia bacterium]
MQLPSHANSSVADVASAYRGNPAALQQRVGMTQELVDLLALQKLKAEKEAAARQMQMGQPAQGMPTVAQGLQQEAMQNARQEVQEQLGLKSALAGRQQLAQQQLMAQMSAGPTPVPEGTPQPQRQPTAGGLGAFAHGGVVTFADGGSTDKKRKYETPYDRMNRLNRERGEMSPELLALLEQIPTEGYAPAPEGERVSGSELDRNLSNILMAMPGAGATRAMTPARAGLAALGAVMSPSGSAPRPAAPSAPRVEAPVPDTGDETARLLARHPAPAPAPAALPPSLPPAPAAGGAPRASGGAGLTAAAMAGRDQESEFGKFLERQLRAAMGASPDAARAASTKRYEDMVGAQIRAAAQAREGRAKAMEAAQSQEREGRSPFVEWTRGINPYARSLGEGLAGASRALGAARGRWSESDAKRMAELDNLRADIEASQIKGAEGAFGAGAKGEEMSEQARRQAMQSGVSLESTREAAAARRQAALESMRSRIDAATDRSDQRYREQAMKLAMAAAQKEKDNVMNMTKYKDVTVEEIAAGLFDKLYTALKSGTMVPQSAPAAGAAPKVPPGYNVLGRNPTPTK